MTKLSWDEWYKQDLERQEALAKSKHAGSVPMDPEDKKEKKMKLAKIFKRKGKKK